MPSCELCGRSGALARAVIEGAEMLVCTPCAAHGRVLGRTRKNTPSPPRPSRKEPAQRITPDYGSLIKKRREKLGLTQEELARKLAEKESQLHAIESSRVEPSIALARKLEKLLHLTLVEEDENMEISAGTKNAGQVTLGDLARVRKRSG